jgi:hypothetical protein
VLRKCSLVLISAAVRDHTGGIKAETAFAKGVPELHAHEGVVEAHSGRCVRVGGKIEKSRLLYHLKRCQQSKHHQSAESMATRALNRVDTCQLQH